MIDNTKVESPKNYTLYILKLNQEKYYVGVTSKPVEVRMQEHINRFKAAEWTKIYKPLFILDSKQLGYITYSQAEVTENKVTREYIKKYGIANVRGGDITYPGKIYVFAKFYMSGTAVGYLYIAFLILALSFIAFL